MSFCNLNALLNTNRAQGIYKYSVIRVSKIKRAFVISFGERWRRDYFTHTTHKSIYVIVTTKVGNRVKHIVKVITLTIFLSLLPRFVFSKYYFKT